MNDFPVVNRIEALADQIVEQLQEDPESVMMLPLPYGLPAQERARKIDEHTAVVAEIRRRGIAVASKVKPTKTGIAFFVDLVEPDEAA